MRQTMYESLGWPEVGSNVNVLSANWMVTSSGFMMNPGVAAATFSGYVGCYLCYVKEH